MDLRSEQLALDLKVLVVVHGSNESDFLWAKIGYPSIYMYCAMNEVL